MLSPKSVVCGLVVLFLFRGTVINKFCQNLWWDKIYKWTCLAALFETIEAVKLTFYIGLQNWFDGNCLTLGMRLYSMTVLLLGFLRLVKNCDIITLNLMSPGYKIWFLLYNIEIWTSPGNLKSLNCLTCIVILLKGCTYRDG